MSRRGVHPATAASHRAGGRVAPRRASPCLAVAHGLQETSNMNNHVLHALASLLLATIPQTACSPALRLLGDALVQQPYASSVAVAHACPCEPAHRERAVQRHRRALPRVGSVFADDRSERLDGGSPTPELDDDPLDVADHVAPHARHAERSAEHARPARPRSDDDDADAEDDATPRESRARRAASSAKRTRNDDDAATPRGARRAASSAKRTRTRNDDDDDATPRASRARRAAGTAERALPARTRDDSIVSRSARFRPR
jgi:hypothetical protein